MKHYIYRPVATEDDGPQLEGDFGTFVGQNLGGRQVGYFSRSSAVAAGHGSGHPFMIERSNPVTFGHTLPSPEEQARETTARLGAALAELVLAGNTAAAHALAEEIAR
ncbi:hypothetical protein [Brachybacterium kimchii]|uniref:Uncharacterized protein n=1 Tax=Brachybacterium kimchii TaxID=2942909 RepID=A0ABY4N803_9MICO|nr:hypothetical protein [Brachybacterium kimchii]UQN30689.1 hypothetical protein M4486_05135 [Brachybacterium kimchii]